MRKNRLFAMLITLILLAASFVTPASALVILNSEEDMPRMLNGTWKGAFHVPLTQQTHANDQVELNFIYSPDGSRLYLTVQSCDAKYVNVQWSIQGQMLVLDYNQAPWQSHVELWLEDEKTLNGTYTQYGQTFDTTLKKTSGTPVDKGRSPQYQDAGETTTYSDWMEQLKKYPEYSQNTASIPFSYELGNKTKLSSLIKELNLDERMANQPDDVSQMIELLNAVCDNFRHDGASGMPASQDVVSVINYAKAKKGIECRGLSIILADLCRAYGIPAKSIKCSSADVYSEYCHVVVHAYSKSLGQWIMLDPTYRVMLQNEKGEYMSLPMLREALINGATLIPNENAGRNHRPFYLDQYRAYMTKNSFHFSSATNFAFGTDGAAGNTIYTLTPLGYNFSYAYSRGETPTTDANEFWKAPSLA